MSQYFQILLRLSSHHFAADRGAETSETSSNSRPADTVKQIASIVRGMDGKRLRYQDLVA